VTLDLLEISGHKVIRVLEERLQILVQQGELAQRVLLGGQAQLEQPQIRGRQGILALQE
jgi:hypothetical protein